MARSEGGPQTARPRFPVRLRSGKWGFGVLRPKAGGGETRINDDAADDAESCAWSILLRMPLSPPSDSVSPQPTEYRSGLHGFICGLHLRCCLASNPRRMQKSGSVLSGFPHNEIADAYWRLLLRSALRATPSHCPSALLLPLNRAEIPILHPVRLPCADGKQGSDEESPVQRRDEPGYGLRRLKGMMPLRILTCCRRVKQMPGIFLSAAAGHLVTRQAPAQRA